MQYKRMPIEIEAPEELGYDNIEYNLAESSVTDLRFSDLNLSLNDLKLEYIAHRGKPAFRKMIAAEAPGLQQDHVLLTSGAAGALFIINTTLLSPADHLIVVRPNYATNIEVAVAIGCNISYIDVQFEEQWKINIEAIEKAITPATKLISVTTPHNPTGTVISGDELNRLMAIAEKRNIYLLVDETYRHIAFTQLLPVMASLSKKVISVSSLSKGYGLPGLRMGWLITKDDTLMEKFLAAKEMIFISNSALDEEVAHQFYQQKDQFAKSINAKVIKHLQILTDWLQQETRMECILPKGGVVCFPRIKASTPINTENFYSTLLQQYKTLVGRGHWFAMPDTYMRIGFGWTDTPTFQQGLENISKTITECSK